MSSKNCPDCKSYYLDAIPEDVWEIIVDVQAEEVKKTKTQVGKRETIYRIIRRYAKQKEGTTEAQENSG